MARPRRRGGESALNAWPGYVDALSTLLMVIIFVLLVFVLAQGFLTVTLSNRDQALEQVNHRLAELTDMLALERGKTQELRASVAQLNQDLRSASAARDSLTQQLADTAQQVRALTALRDQLQQQTQDTAARAMSEAERRAATESLLADEKKLSDSARAQIALLTRQVDELRAQMEGLSRALDLAQQSDRDKATQIATLGARLNAALAAKVEELQRYRSEFFGRLRDVLANRPGIQVVGDRFVFQSEVLFPTGSATLSPAGQDQLAALAATIREIATAIPPNLPWMLRVDGHADRQPLTGRGGYATNWELSAARAITVVKQLIAEGVPPEHLAATGFGDHQPLDPADTPEAYARNRRIELRLTDR